MGPPKAGPRMSEDIYVKKILTISTALAGLAFSVAGAMAADIKPAVLYDLGGRFDKSFNEAAYTGAEQFKAETAPSTATSKSRTTASASRHCGTSQNAA
jgi:basic membrane protein A